MSDGGSVGNGSKSRSKGGKEDEEQYILRLPAPLSEQMRLGLASKAKRDAAGSEARFSVHFISERYAFFYLNEERYAATLHDLPAIVESHKTADKRTYYKSADIHQVLIVALPALADDAAHPKDVPDGDDEPFTLADGISAASRGAAKRFYVPHTKIRADQIRHVERRMKYVADNKLAFIRKKTEPATEPLPNNDDADVIIEEEVEPPVPTPDTPATPAPSGVTPAVSTPIDTAPLPTLSVPVSTAATPVAASPQPQTPANDAPTPLDATFPSAAGTPLEAVDDDLDEFTEMLGGTLVDATPQLNEEEEAVLRLQRTKLDSEIEEQKGKIKAKQDEAAKMPNFVLKSRILSKVPELEAALHKLEEERKKL